MRIGRTEHLPGGPDLWERLTRTQPLASSAVHRPDSAGLHAALRIVEDGVLDGSVPSAGGLHPYELLVLTRDAGRPVLFQVDLARRTCLRTEAAVPDLPVSPDGEAHVLLLNRPWV
ncbi:MAG: hypothetical protein QOF58_1091, partial [Pseudonocardiales bacterium]|nr:hypothetical protein [Pseudonocardiales bacterium]